MLKRLEGGWAESCYTNDNNCAFLRTEVDQFEEARKRASIFN